MNCGHKNDISVTHPLCRSHIAAEIARKSTGRKHTRKIAKNSATKSHGGCSSSMATRASAVTATGPRMCVPLQNLNRLGGHTHAQITLLRSPGGRASALNIAQIGTPLRFFRAGPPPNRCRKALSIHNPIPQNKVFATTEIDVPAAKIRDVPGGVS